MLGLEKIDNISLRPALARYLMHIPEGPAEYGRFEHPWNLDVFTLSAETARPMIAGALLALVGTLVWRLRRTGGDLCAIAVWDCAALAVVALLLSPITWRQHGVAILPACYLLARFRFSRGSMPAVARVAIGALVVVSLLLSRGVMGRTIASLVHAYYLHTLALLLLLAAVLSCRSRLQVREDPSR